jgi:hypothetical protein
MVFDITFGVLDNDADKANTSIHVQENLTLAQYQEFAWRYAQIVENIIYGVIQNVATLRLALDLSSLTGNGAPDIDSDVEQRAQFISSAADGTTTELNIPALVEGQIAVGTDEMDTTDTNIAALIAMLEDGLTVTGAVTVQPTNINSSDIVSVLSARSTTVNSGKRR